MFDLNDKKELILLLDVIDLHFSSFHPSSKKCGWGTEKTKTDTVSDPEKSTKNLWSLFSRLENSSEQFHPERYFWSKEPDQYWTVDNLCAVVLFIGSLVFLLPIHTSKAACSLANVIWLSPLSKYNLENRFVDVYRASAWSFAARRQITRRN